MILEDIKQLRQRFCHLIGTDVIHPYQKYKKIIGTVFEKIDIRSMLEEKYSVTGPNKGK